MDTKKYIASLEEKCLGETFNATSNENNKIATYNNKTDSTCLTIYYDESKNITISEFYDNKYWTTIAFKTKLNPDEIVFYHTYFIIQND